MIVVVEGVSATGKTTWAEDQGAVVIGEVSPTSRQLALLAEDPARGWAEIHAARWQAAVEAERRAGVVVCDTDPMKLHYTWCEFRASLVSRAAWDRAVHEHRRVFRAGSLGFADAVVLLDPREGDVRRQRAEDDTRRRRNFEKHLSFRPWLLEWYAALERLEPGHVFVGPDVDLSGLPLRSHRSGDGAFDGFLRELEVLTGIELG